MARPKNMVLLGDKPSMAKMILATIMDAPMHPQTDLIVAVEQITGEGTHDGRRSFKHYFANHGTPPRKHRTRYDPMIQEYRPGKLFKGHRI